MNLLTRHYLRDQTLSPVVVHLTSDRTIRGFVREAAKDVLVLTDATYLSESGNTDLGGDVAIPHERIEFVQMVDRA